jgi:hypothetical protein
MDATPEEFFNDFRQELLAGAEANGSFLLTEFMESVTKELIETGFTEGFEFCHYRAQRGMRVDGYWFNDEGVLDLFVAEVDAAFKRATKFVEASIGKGLAKQLEVTSPEYGLARLLEDRKGVTRQINLFLISERALSGKIQSLAETEVAGIPTSFHIWDLTRLMRQRSSRSHKEPLDLDFESMFGSGISCLPAHLGEDAYEKYGARLLEQNVRTFLQARGSVNQGIRSTIMTEPGMFFAYNNGITATAQGVQTRMTNTGLQIVGITDLQIVNGGQTTASLFHTRKRDKADLARIFVQMKLSVIDSESSELVVPRISEYANTQNRVNAADFFSNHPFHIRMETFSRRLWAPAQRGAQRETRWFYERARGQYADAQSKLNTAEQKRFKAEHPKPQMFTKTDLAKFENVWDDHPKWVNLGAQKNFAKYASRIGKEWEKSSDRFNEFYFRRAVARGLIFRAAERVVSSQPWYNDYRANIVAYTLASLNEIATRRGKALDFLEVWNAQGVGDLLNRSLAVIAKAVNDDIIHPPQGISNIGEWCKKDACWIRIQGLIGEMEKSLPQDFDELLVSIEDQAIETKAAKQTQKMDNGIEAQRRVLEIPAKDWKRLHDALSTKFLLNPKEIGILNIAMQIPAKIPTEKQCTILLEALEKGRLEGISIH